MDMCVMVFALGQAAPLLGMQPSLFEIAAWSLADR
jgi:hypothetical protein